MLRYELKKIFTKTGCRIALAILAVTVLVVCYLACDVKYVNESGETERGIGAIAQLRKMQKEWAGPLDEAKIAAAMSLNGQIINSPEYRSANVRERECAYSRRQGIREIRELLNHSYTDEFRSYDYYLADRLNADDAGRFYGNRPERLKEWLEADGAVMYSAAEKEYLLHQYETLETPFYYDYLAGWKQLFEYSLTVIMITMLILGYIVAGIFSSEFSWRAEAIFFAAKYGRNRAIAAKLKAGFLTVTGLYFMIITLYSGITLSLLGTDGMNCEVQLINWKSMYNLKIWQEYVLIVLGGYLGCLFIAALCMYVSAKTTSAVTAVIIPFVLLFIPSFIGNINSPAVNKILGLLPDQLLQVSNVLTYFNLYEIGGKAVSALAVLLIMYPLMAVLLYPVIYFTYKKKQI